jgi:hypothetical protein
VKANNTASSSNGRTADFDSVNGGSTPSLAANSYPTFEEVANNVGSRVDDAMFAYIIEQVFSGQGPKDQARKGDYIETYSGQTFYVLDPRMEEIVIEDISHALSNACRFSGHTKRFFSVAEHSCNVADYLYKRYSSKKLARFGLFHDGSETYFVDIPRPIKPCLNNYKEIEEGIQTLIYEKFCGEAPNEAQYKLIKHADNVMLFAEAHNLMLSRGIGWQDYHTYIKEAQDVEIIGLSPEDAKHRFVLTYHSLLDITG